MNTLSFLSQALVAASSTREADFARADDMYSSSFRGLPKTVESVFGGMSYEELAEDGSLEWYDVDGSTLICSLCSYKGEGAGWVLFGDVKHLPVFKSKASSAAYFNI